jgi:hypothetical protein
MSWGAVIGAGTSIAGSFISKPKKSKDPNAYLQPYLKDAAAAAQTQFNQGGPPLAPLSDPTRAGLASQISRSAAGSPLVDTAQQFTQAGLQRPISTLFGADQPFGNDQNPGLDAAFNYAADKTMNRTSSEFARGGRNLDASLPVRSDILSSLAAQIYGPAYESERNRQLQYGNSERDRMLGDLNSQRGLQQNLLGFASPLASQDYVDISQQRDAGAFYDAQEQARLDQPSNNLDAYLNRLGGLAGKAGQIMPSTPRPNYLAAGLGGAILGRELFPGNPPQSDGAGYRDGYTPWQPLKYSFSGNKLPSYGGGLMSGP